MDTLFGLPAHPFLVHIPIVFLPLAALGVLAMACRHVWYVRFRWVVLAIGGVGTLGTILAASAGEELEGRIEAVEGREAARSWQHHAELGDAARSVAIIFFVLLAAYVLVPWLLERRAGTEAPTAREHDRGGATEHVRSPGAPVRLALAALAVLAAAGSVVTVIQAGHSGSKSVWEDYLDDTSGG